MRILDGDVGVSIARRRRRRRRRRKKKRRKQNFETYVSHSC